MTREDRYLEYLKEPKAPQKIPFIRTVTDLAAEWAAKEGTFIDNEVAGKHVANWGRLRDLGIKQDNKTGDISIQTYQKGATISEVGRLQGNMEYLEDCWNVQIQPPSFKYAFVKNGEFDTITAPQAKIRDKYLKIRVRYDGKKYVMVNAIKTFYTLSYA